MALLLRQDEVAGLLDLPTAIAVTERLFAEQAAGDLAPSAPRLLRLRHGTMRMVAGALQGTGRAGIRVSAGASDPPLAVLYDSESGKVLSIQAYPYSSLRIGATVGLSVRRLAPERVATVGLIGSGRNAQSLLEGVCWARPDVREIRVFSRRPEHREQFARAVQDALGRVAAPVESGQRAVEGAQIVLTATDPREPVLLGEWLGPGQCVVSIGRPNELAADVYQRADFVVVTSLAHEQDYWDRTVDQPLLDLVACGEVRWHEIGDVLAGRVQPPKAADQALTVVRESQGGVGDVALAGWVYERARALGLGREWSFG
ncbi:MAG TPA: NAD(P)-binding domain-containing protein [Chloroflexota bacterium]|jgi:ornithine cyclodeaminase